MSRGMPNRSRGMTLLEMLVVLVLMAFITVLVSQALEQMGRIERLLQGTRLNAAHRAVQAAWLKEALESLLPAEIDSPQRFGGAERRLHGITSSPPSDVALGLAQLQLEMVYLPTVGVTELRLGLASPQEADATLRETPDTQVAARWSGDVGRFRYMDAQGQWQPTWPPPGIEERLAPLLPVAIMVETNQAERPSLLAAISATPIGMPSRRKIGEL